jgi:hypothetical protein
MHYDVLEARKREVIKSRLFADGRERHGLGECLEVWGMVGG